MSLSLLTTIALTVGWMTVSVTGVILLIVALRGRRVDFLPRCRACRYVIDSGFDSTTCSECGADLTESGTIRLGVRHINEPKFVFAILLLLISAGPVVLLIANNNASTVVTAAAPIVTNPKPAGIAQSTAASTPSIRRSNDWTISRAEHSTLNTNDTVRVVYGSLIEQSIAQMQSQTWRAMSTDEYGPVVLDSMFPRQPTAASIATPTAFSELTGASEARVYSSNTGISSAIQFGQISDVAYSVDLPPLVQDFAPLTVNLRGLGKTIRHQDLSGAASPWSSSSIGSPQPIELKMTNTAVKPNRIGGSRR